MIVSQSTIGTWDRCRRKWWLSQYRGLARPSEYRSPASIGNLVHGALEQYYLGAYGEASAEFVEPIAYVKETAVRLIGEHPDFAAEIAKDAEMAGIMVDGYMAWLEETGADGNFETVEPEREIRAHLIDGIELVGKLDAKVLTKDGWTGFLENKTVQNFTDLPSYSQLNRQLLTYDLLEFLEIVEAGAAPFPKVDGAILNMLRKVKRTASAVPPFYERHIVQHNVEELRNHWRHVVGIAQEIQRVTEQLDAGGSHHMLVPPTPTRDCRFTCEFFTVCPLFDDGSDVEAVLEFEYVRVDPMERYTQEVET